MFRYVTWLLVGLFGFIGVFEVSVRLVEDRLETPLEWYEKSSQQRVWAMDQIARSGVETDIAVVGTSMVRRGVDIELLQEELDPEATIWKAALPAAQTTLMERWAVEEVLPKLQPERLVWGVSSLDFNTNRPVKPITLYDEARATRAGLLGSADRLLGRASVASRYRARMRDLSIWGDILEPGEKVLVARDILRAKPVDRGKRTRREARRLQAGAVYDFEMGEEEIEAFKATIVAAEAQSIEVVVVAMPVSSGYIDLHPNGADDFHGFLGELETLTTELGVEYVDLSESRPTRDFADYTHLNRRGAARFTRQLAAELSRLGW